jgi:hypothetical protein
MTLSTYVYVLDQVDYREVFVKCNQLIGAHEGVRFSEHDGWIGNGLDQGLCALMHVDHGAPLVTPAQAAQHDEDCEPDCNGDHWDRACWLKVNFDTAYSYSGPDGGCGDLHARLVAELGQWLDERGARWEWRNEFTGEVHQGYDGLTELASGGAQASDWFRNIAAPAIAAHIASGQ